MFKHLQTKALLLLGLMIAGAGTVWAQTAEVNSVLWTEQFTGGSTSTTFSETNSWANYVNPTTLVSSDVASLSYASSNACITQSTGANMNGSHVWLNKSTTGYWQVEGIKLYNATKVKVTWAQGGAVNITVSYAFDGGSTYTNLYSNSTAGASISSSELDVSGHTTINLKFQRASNKTNVRIDDMTLVATEVSSSTPDSDPVAVTGVTLSEETLELAVGDSETLTATVAPSNATNKTVNWSSSDETVATVEGGVVTGVKKGSATITAMTEDGEYAATCAVTVTAAPIIIEAEEAIVFSEKGYSNGGTLSTAEQGDITLTFATGTGSNNPAYYTTGTAARLYTNNTLTVASSDKNIAKIEFTFSGTYTGTLSASVGSYTSPTWKGRSKSVTFTNTGSTQARIQSIAITYEHEYANVGEAGWATYVTTNAVQFPATVTAYVVPLADQTYVFLQQVTEVPAGTPVIIEAEEGSYELAIVSEASAPEDNELLVSDGTTATSDNDTYVLSKQSGKVGFYKWGGAASLSKGKVYLKLEAVGGSARQFVPFGSETTGIDSMSNEQCIVNSCIYDLQGRRTTTTSQLKRGLYIVNGKKVLVK